MQWLLAGGELLAGIVALVLWWMALRFISGDGSKPLSNMQFAVLPCVFLLWFVGGFVLVLQGLGAI
jgi:hypothetical protein